jgi:general secretion pathway protein D
MDRRRALVLLACWAVLGASERAFAREISVYGIELETSEERERLLIFADAPIEPELLPFDERTLMIALPGAVLDPSAPTLVTPKVQGTIVRVTAFDRNEGRPEVRVVVQRRPGAPPHIERRASVVAVDFEGMMRSAPVPTDSIRIGYHNAPIATVVAEIARATGETIVFDESVSALGTVTIEGPPQASRAEALALIDSLLLLRGFAAVPAPGGARKIAPINGSISQWTRNGRMPDTDAPITTLLRLESARASDLLPVLTPYLGANATAAAYQPTNSLILSGPSSLLRTLRVAITALDHEASGPPLIWPMRVARAETVADQLVEIAGELEVPFASADKRLNALILRVRQGDTEHVRSIVDRLDRPARGAAGVQVVKLRYADPKKLAEQLIALRDGGASPSGSGDRPGGLSGLEFEVVPDGPTHSLVLRAAPETVSAVLDVVSDLDRVPPSVRVEITVALVDLDDQLDLGVDYFIPTLTNPKTPSDLIASVTANPSGGGIPTAPSADRPFIAAFTRAPLLLTITDPITGVAIPLAIPRESGAITMNGRTARANLLIRPSLLITSGEEHEIFAGDNVPIPVAQPQGGGLGTGFGTGTGTSTGTGTGTGGTGSTSTGGTSGATGAAASGIGNAAIGDTGTGTGTTGTTAVGLQTGLADVRQNIERKDVGTTLRVTPTVGQQGGVTLQLRVEVSTLTPSLVGPVEDVGPSIREIQVESTIRLQGEEVAVIATAAREIVSTTATGTPWLMDIPVLGWAFRVTQDQTQKQHLLVAARAQILRPEARDIADRLARELGSQRAALDPR